MLTNKTIEKIKIKMIKENLNQSQLARKIKCSNGAMTQMLSQTKEFKNAEVRLLNWLYNKYAEKNNEEMSE